MVDLEKEHEDFKVEFAKQLDNFRKVYGSHTDQHLSEDLAKHFFTKGWQIAKAQAVPEGFVLVPKEPTNKMLEISWMKKSSYDMYKAMIEAAQGEKE